MSDNPPENNDDELAAKMLEALERHHNPKDQIMFFDPYLSVVSPPARHPRMDGGYKLWPLEEPEAKPDLKIMTIGNSTSLWPAYPWSLELAEMLTRPDRLVEVWHGAGKGNSSSQELMRVLRDAPAVKPDMIISLSGICDIGYLLNANGHPHLHKYVRRVLDFAFDAGIVTRQIFYGPHDAGSPAQIWCRNQRFARVLADEMGIELVVFLQPVQGYGTYKQTREEKKFYASKAKVILKAADKSYGQCVQEFYTEVANIMRANPTAYDHIIDFTEVFADCPGAYKDHRHQTPLGVTHLANKMLPIIEQKVIKGTLK